VPALAASFTSHVLCLTTSRLILRTRTLAWCMDRAVGGAEALGDVGDRPPQLWMPILQFKLNQNRRHHIPRQRRQVTTGRPTTPACASAAV